MSNFDTAFDLLIGNEGGYVNNPVDPGGETNWGITRAVAVDNGYTGSMKSMPKETAKQIYKKMYWDKLQCDQLGFAVAFQLFDAGVNHGNSQAVKFLQRALSVVDDGMIGAKTIAATNSLDDLQIVMLFNAERIEFYAALKTFSTFGKGWVRRVASNLKLAAK
jgi:lysozyme family protein